MSNLFVLFAYFFSMPFFSLFIANKISAKSREGSGGCGTFFFLTNALFVRKKKRNIDNKTFYWLKSTKNNKYLNKSFQRQEKFSIVNNFIMLKI